MVQRFLSKKMGSVNQVQILVQIQFLCLTACQPSGYLDHPYKIAQSAGAVEYTNYITAKG